MMLKRILNIFYPRRCMFCGKKLNNKSEYYCFECFVKLPFVEENRCLICGREIYGDNKLCLSCREHKRYVDVNYPVFVYKGIIKEALLKHKFAGRMWYYKPFADFIYNNIKDKISNIDYIVYPPVNKKTFYKRGYNQSELIACETGKKVNINVLRKCIRKNKDNEKQSLMTAKNRYKNVKGIFRVEDKYKNMIKGKNILFIDDIMTTGATIDECAKILKRCGANMVISSTLCISQ